MSLPPPLIIVVDDEISICRALARLMLSAGFEVEAFTSGAQLFEFLKTRSAQCLVLDLHMPEMTGFEVQARLAQCGCKLPVVTITGHDTLESRQRVLDAGASAYLSKPVNGHVLLEAINTAMKSTLEPGAAARDTLAQQ